MRQQLEESHRTNEALTNDLQKLTNDWESLRDELLSKEDEWKEEEQVSSATNSLLEVNALYKSVGYSVFRGVKLI